MAELALLILMLWPMTCFFRMAYAESMFVLVVVLVLHGMVQQWPTWLLAVLVGLATATRPVGVALVPALAWHLWRRSPSIAAFVRDALGNLPLSCWGLLGYMAYLGGAFGDPFCFARTQDHWWLMPKALQNHKLLNLLILEPVWGVFMPDSPRYWARFGQFEQPWFSMMFANPLAWLLAWLLLGVGWRKRWLSGEEIVLSVGLLLIPYLTRAHEMSMASHGRFAAVVVPMYLLLARLIAASPPPLRPLFLCGSAVFLFTYSALYAANRFVF